MSYPTHFKKLFCEPEYKAARILQALAALSHCIYLQNNGKARIAFLAERYCVQQNHQHFYFQKTALDQYELSPTQLDLTAHLGALEDADTAPFCSVMGFVSYDAAAQQHINMQSRPQPSIFLGQFKSYLQQETDGWYFYSSDDAATQIFDFILNLYTQSTIIEQFQLSQKCQARWNFTDYQRAFQHVQDYIVAGDCYQINLTQEFSAEAQGQLLETAAQFWQLTNAPYAGYLRIGDFEILSCSPELFIDFEENRKITTKPIKGTMPRYGDPELDRQSKQQLSESKKDQAENVMIVDLLRNDLSVYAETGSVKTPKLFNIESFNQVHHMVSEVTATLKAEMNPFDVLMSALPGGSITGAPKIRAMQIIDELEGAARGAYCGSMGYFDADGTGSWNILIRSIQKYQQDVSLWAGGGVTIASVCEAEYQECFDKVSAMLDLLNRWYKPAQ
ncbi:aminodeoxychorismate synthase component I [Acinetobacter towneri]|uniref:aminodeoxychorismate synthase component I n=1 Tax=Acinetobacter towneri TaxID=202956 RepID=UPI0020974B92|nr:aminodeoxychorismate synthase component I [Acinetobacter towneri]MCO8060151.1 aminodeoxychorismate synthase component I [Acinetobacter towneri]MCO8065801.1 aminodeoxychorismate synthase component I [Acinetobacter towneri]